MVCCCQTREIDWQANIALHDFYKLLFEIRNNNKALHGFAEVVELTTREDDKIFAYLLMKDAYKVLVLLNLLPNDRVHCILTHEQLSGTYRNLFSGIHYHLNSMEKFELQAWEYIVYVSE